MVSVCESFERSLCFRVEVGVVWRFNFLLSGVVGEVGGKVFVEVVVLGCFIGCGVVDCLGWCWEVYLDFRKILGCVG